MTEEKKDIGAGHIALVILGVLIIAAAITGLWYADKKAAPERDAYRKLAQCLSEKEVQFYSAFWCPNCAMQKSLFKGSGKKLPHIECSLPDRTQNEFCENEKITNYPTWEFNGNLRCVGVVSPEVLAHLSGCPLPVYGDTELTVEHLYVKLILQEIADNLKKRSISADAVEGYIEEVESDINAYLTENHQTTAEETENIEHFLDAVVEAVHDCEPYERKKESEEERSAEAEETAQENVQ